MTVPETLVDSLSVHARRAPRRAAIRHRGALSSYAALHDAAGRTAYLLRASGVRPGDRVALMLPNVEQFVSCYHGALRAGAVVVPLDPALGSREVCRRLLDADAATLIAWHDREAVARRAASEGRARLFLVEPDAFGELLDCVDPIEPIPRASRDTGVLLYGARPSGPLKGVQLTHRNLVMSAAVCGSLFGLDEESVTLGAVPLWRAFGQTCVLNATLAAGGCVSLLPDFDAVKALEAVERDRVSVLEGTRSMYAALVASGRRREFDVSSLRLCVCIGTGLSESLRWAFEDAFGLPVQDGYGRRETSAVATFSTAGGRSRGGSVGRPVDGVEVRVATTAGCVLAPGQVGEIHVHGHNVMKGYWRRPALTTQAIDQDGWLRTGDRARIDEDGYVYLVDEDAVGGPAGAFAMGVAA